MSVSPWVAAHLRAVNEFNTLVAWWAGAYTRPLFDSSSQFGGIRWLHDFPPVY
jgi:hypothetical protein